MDDTGRVEINTFVDKMTRGLIPEFIKELDPGTQAILINTLYFYANWQNQFDAAESKEGDFFTKPLEPVKAIYMKDSGFYSGFETENYSAIVLPYEPIEIPGNSMPTKTEMVVLLPKQDISNSTALKAYLNQAVHKNLPQYVEEYYNVVLPKFEINTELNLTKTLAQLGVKKAFSSQADFSKLSPTPLVISDVIQNVSIRVDEKGTEAAAATAIMLMRAMLPPQSKPFVVNRPFAFVIREQETSNVLFMGAIAQPEAPKAK
jgi:serpin B